MAKKPVNTERLTEHLINGIALLKQIRERNEEENKQIDAYLEVILKDLQEEEKPDDQGKAEGPDGTSSKEQEEAPSSESSEKKTSSESQDKSTTAQGQVEKEKKVREALEQLEEMLIKRAEEKEKEARPVITIDSSEGEGDAEQTVSLDTGKEAKVVPKKLKKTKNAPVAAVEELPEASGGDGGSPEIEDSADYGKVWCAVCEEYHGPEDDI